MIVGVDWEPDARGDPRPVRLHLDGRSLALVAIRDVWPGADHTYVKAEDETGTTWILRHDRFLDRWEVTLFERQPAAPRQEQ